jgi:hypothetical protein
MRFEVLTAVLLKIQMVWGRHTVSWRKQFLTF